MVVVVIEKIVAVLGDIEFGKGLILRRVDVGFKLGFGEGLVATAVNAPT